MLNIVISKAGKALPVDWDAMPEIAKQHIIDYGLRQKLNDAGSQFTKDKEGEAEAGAKSFAAAESVLSALMAGNVRINSRMAQTSEGKMFTRCLRELFKKFLGKIPEKFDNTDCLEALAKKLEKPVEAISAAIEKQARALIEIEKAKTAISIEL